MYNYIYYVCVCIFYHMVGFDGDESLGKKKKNKHHLNNKSKLCDWVVWRFDGLSVWGLAGSALEVWVVWVWMVWVWGFGCVCVLMGGPWPIHPNVGTVTIQKKIGSQMVIHPGWTVYS